jgi:D-arginine dehydrogenase
MSEPAPYDAIVIGGGIAGISISAVLSKDLRVVMLERESVPMYHSTSRSAAMLIENYGGRVMEQFVRASRPFFVDPPEEIRGASLAGPRGWITLARPGQESELERFYRASKGTEWLSGVELCQRISPLVPGRFSAGVLDPSALDLDVDQLCQAYLRQFRHSNGKLVCNARVMAMHRRDGQWRVKTENDEYRAPLIVDAAGAWADDVAAMAQIRCLGLIPYRRTAAIVAFERAPDPEWPMLGDLDETWYAHPEGEWMMVSLSEETAVQPCDAWPEDIDVATAIDNFQQAIDLGEVTKLVSSWAGLRTFAPDRHPVVGFEGSTEGFFWFAGQGGSGIHSAPGLAEAAAALITANTYPEWFSIESDYVTALAPNRFGCELGS